MTRSTAAMDLVRALRHEQRLIDFSARLLELLISENRTLDDLTEPLVEADVRALFQAVDLIDSETAARFYEIVEGEAARRVALFELLELGALSEEPQVRQIAFRASADDRLTSGQIPWLSLVLACVSWRTGYMLRHMDPQLLPGPDSPAGRTLREAARFVHRQVERSPVDLRGIDRQLDRPPERAPTLDELSPAQEAHAPLPPHYRPPVPERYVEMADETITIKADELPDRPTSSAEEPLRISPEELGGAANDDRDVSPEVRAVAPLQLVRQQLAEPRAAPPSPIPGTGVIMPNSTQQSRPSFSVALRQMFGREELANVRLRISVELHPDGPGIFGCQVRITSKGIRSELAGTSDRQGMFVCELPVRVHSGLTYDVDVTWPRELGGDTERKSVTLSTERTGFALPFYRRLNPEQDETG
jgi:hypothetical protein